MNDWYLFLEAYERYLFLVVALPAFLLLAYAKTRRRRIASACVLLVSLLPHLQRGVGNLYLDYLCKNVAGEFIYRTVDNVDGLLMMRWRDGSKDYFDRMAAGDLPEDPYGHTNWEARNPASILVAPRANGYQFLEAPTPAAEQVDRNEAAPPPVIARSLNHTHVRYSVIERDSERTIVAEPVDQLRSRYGYTWHEVRRPILWLLNIHKGELVVVDHHTGEELGRRVGFLRHRLGGTCPPSDVVGPTRDFLARVLRPESHPTSVTKHTP